MHLFKAFLGLVLLCGVLAQCMATTPIPGTGPAVGPASLLDVSPREASALNAIRARHGLGALTPNSVLARVARSHGQDMLENRFFGHVSSDGSTIVERTRAQGYDFCHVGENLAMGQRSFDQVLRHWMGSPTHRSNVLHKNVSSFGLVRGPGNLWVMVVGSPGCAR